MSSLLPRTDCELRAVDNSSAVGKSITLVRLTRGPTRCFSAELLKRLRHDQAVKAPPRRAITLHA